MSDKEDLNTVFMIAILILVSYFSYRYGEANKLSKRDFVSQCQTKYFFLEEEWCQGFAREIYEY